METHTMTSYLKNMMSIHVAKMVLTRINNEISVPIQDIIIVMPKHYSLQIRSETHNSQLLRNILTIGVSQTVVNDNFIKLENGILLMNGDIDIGDDNRGIIIPYKLMEVHSKNKLIEFLEILTNQVLYKYIARHSADFDGDVIQTYQVCHDTNGCPTSINLQMDAIMLAASPHL